MKYKYGEFDSSQIDGLKKDLRKKIFFLLLVVDPDTRDEYKDRIDIEKAFVNLLTRIGGLNELFKYPQEIVTISSLLEAARLELYKEPFEFGVYRKLILDAGSEVLKIEEV